MTHYTATIDHHSISRARIIRFEAATLSAAKRAAYREFQGEQRDYLIVLRPDEPHPESMYIRRVGAVGRGSWLTWR